MSIKLVVVANVSKPRMKPAIDELLPWLRSQADVVLFDTDKSADLCTVDADAILVLGGDGTLLSTANRLGGRSIPVMGVNFGRLGFLASFTPAELQRYFDDFIAGRLPVSQRIMLEAFVVPASSATSIMSIEDVRKAARHHRAALNDVVVTAGPPFRMIELEIGVDSPRGVRFMGDGVVIATPSGSTAYNTSAGGPILWPTVDGICLTPLCPHSLTFKPVVVASSSCITLTARRVNAGTTLVCDGQNAVTISQGEKLLICKSENTVSLVENPNLRQIDVLAEKLQWAAGPRYNHK